MYAIVRPDASHLPCTNHMVIDTCYAKLTGQIVALQSKQGNHAMINKKRYAEPDVL